MRGTLLLVLTSLLATSAPAHQDTLEVISRAPTGQEILEKVDRNLVLDQAMGTSTMIVHGRRGRRTITSRFWKKGKNNAFIEYLSPAREKGKKMLKLEDKLWTYSPEPNDRIITISGHLLRQSLMGSDLSYEDMMESHQLIEMYRAVVVGMEEIEGRPCWVLDLTARSEDVSYHSRRIWVDMQRWLPLQEERYAKSGKLLKTTKIVEVLHLDDRWYPKKMIFKDMLSSGEGTEYIIESIDFDVHVPDHKLTKAALRE
jgi:outer membrane lipoprotein-sorting protein